jgi:phenylacetate-CoA ligase
MSAYNSLLENIVLPFGDIFNNSSFMYELKKWRGIQNLNEEELSALNEQNLSKMLAHATTQIPFYKNINIPKKHSSAFHWLQHFPVLRKKDIKGRWDEFILPGSSKLIKYESSGSSGIQGKVFMNKTEQSIIRAILILWWEWAGYKIGNPLVQTGMTPKRGFLKSIKDLLFNTQYFVAFGLEEQEVKKALERILKTKQQHLAGYASSLYVFAKVAKKYGIKLKFKSVISWGDKMFPHYRKEIEQTFNTQVFDTYACNEGLMIAAQFDLPYYYIMSPHVHVEILDENMNQVPDGTMGNVVVTRLDNFSMPLIRYLNGDLALKLPKEKYPENRALYFPMLEKIIGRDTDIVKTKSGKHLIVHFFTGIFEFYPQVKQFRVIQHHLDGIDIEYIPEVDFNVETLALLEKEMRKHLVDEIFDIRFHHVTHIPNSPSGKPQIIVSKLS